MAEEAGNNLRIREIVGFHCQQAAEKYLKAFLTHSRIEFPRTHDLKALLEFAGQRMRRYLNAEKWLISFALDPVIRRYRGNAVWR